MVTLTKANSKGNIYLHVKNLKGLQKWKGISIADDLTPDLNLKGLQKLKGISIADDLTPDQLKIKRDLQAIQVLAHFKNIESKIAGLSIAISKQRPGTSPPCV